MCKERYYKVIEKDGYHLSTKINSDGSQSSLQFSDKDNTLGGPVTLKPVNNSESFWVYLLRRLCDEVVIPAAQDTFHYALTVGYETLSYQIKTYAVPNLKHAVADFSKNISIAASGIKDGLAGKEPKAIQLSKNCVGTKSNISSYKDAVQEDPTYVSRSDAEVATIIEAMKKSALDLANYIRILNNTVIDDNGSNPEVRKEIQQKLKSLTSSDVMQTIELLLDKKNQALLDSESLSLLKSFEDGYFIGNGKKTPIALYMD
ncbi:MAG: hypothetical protein SPF77_11360 [Gemmiger sp.]|uniref:hypothetical protein n=1 Tax=Gemmiger sp. TaxID=2049027 RepID=UPI002A916AAA|nr:hypothetical protein [Gemmiger sp.]MDY5503153.1 hypothetical protein [Gemmiger sp.]